MYKYLIKFPIVFIILSSYFTLFGRQCFDYQLTDGAEPLVDFGMDTTLHWWAITQPFSDRYRLIVDGEELEPVRSIRKPVFSQDSKKWAAFVEDNSGWILITQDSSFRINTTMPGEIIYSSDSRVMSYSYFEGDRLERIVYGDKNFTVYDRVGEVFINQTGEKIAIQRERDGLKTLNIDGKESTVFDDIKPIGFKDDDTFYYAAANGNLWYIYRDFEIISESYQFVDEVSINPKGTSIAYIAKLNSNYYITVLLNDMYNQPIESNRMLYASNLKLHPFEPIISFIGNLNGYINVYVNSTEYFSGNTLSNPFFTHNGDDLFFIGCRINCFASINGERFPLGQVAFLDNILAKKPNSMTYAITTSTSLVMRRLETNELYSGIMTDYTIHPRYNRFEDRYESLGVINDRLYLLTCRD